MPRENVGLPLVPAIKFSIWLKATVVAVARYSNIAGEAVMRAGQYMAYLAIAATRNAYSRIVDYSSMQRLANTV